MSVHDGSAYGLSLLGTAYTQKKYVLADLQAKIPLPQALPEKARLSL